MSNVIKFDKRSVQPKDLLQLLNQHVDKIESMVIIVDYKDETMTPFITDQTLPNALFSLEIAKQLIIDMAHGTAD